MAGLDHALLPGDRGSRVWGPPFGRSPFGILEMPWKLAVLTIAVMTAIFLIDLILMPPFGIGIIYGAAIYLSGAWGRRSYILATGGVCTALTIAVYLIYHWSAPDGAAAANCAFVVVFQGVVLLIVLRGMTASQLLFNQTKLLDQAHDTVVVRGLDASLLYWNKGAEDLFGCTFEAARKKTQVELLGSGTTLPPMTIEKFIQHGPWQGEIVVVKPTGEPRQIECRCSLLYDLAGKPTAILTTGNDVTEHHRAVDELRRSELRYRNIFDTTGIGIWECDLSAVKAKMDALAAAGVTDLRRYLAEHPAFVRETLELALCIDVNEGSARMFGAGSREELIGPLGWAWPDESMAAFCDLFMAARDGVRSSAVEAMLNTLDGRRARFFLSAAYPREVSTRASVYVTLTDITERADAQSALQSAQADLAHATRLTSLGELAASIAHEVNQPLASILSSGQAGLRWLDRSVPDLTAVETSLKNLVSEAKRAGSIVTGIRSLARNDSPTPEHFELNGLINETLRLLGYEMQRSNVSISKRLDREFVTVLADRVQVQQVLINLILNAAQAMTDCEGRDRSIRITSSVSPRGAMIDVTDSGPGVAESVKDRLFTAFTSTRTDGMGLGLSVCASIIKRHGGQIWHESNPAGGASFGFSLPSASISEGEFRID